MQTFRHISIIVLTILTISCSNKQDFNGFYFGRFETDDFNLPVLVHFDNESYIDYFSVPYDTFSYNRVGDKFHFKSKSYHQEYELTIVQKGNQLSYYRPDSDTLIFRLKKSESSNFMFDYLTDKKIKIDLPNGNGKSQTLGDDYRFHNPLYFSKVGNDLLVNFNDTTIKLDSNYYKFLLSYKSNLSEIDKYRFPITLIADKNLTIQELNRLKEHLRIVGYLKISYILTPQGYDKVSYIMRRIPPLTEYEISKYEAYNFDFAPLPPPPPRPDNDFILEHGLMLEYSQDNLMLNNDTIELSELRNKLRDKILSDPNTILAYFVVDTSTYQDYIKILDLVTNVYYDLRDDYLFDKYGIKYRELWDIDERYEEAQEKYPMRVTELDSIDYKTIKYAL